MSNICLETALNELASVGITPEVSHGGKHIRITWQHNGQNRMHTVPLTPSDWRTPLNNKSQIRATLKRDGLIGDNDNAEPTDTVRITVRDSQVVASSLDVARHFSKAHRDVTRAIDRIVSEVGDEFGSRNFTQSSYLTEQSREFRSFDMTRDGFALLVMGFTGEAAMKWKVKYIDAFNAMEAELRKVANVLALPADIADRLAKVEADLKALIDLSLGTAEPGFVNVKAYRRRIGTRKQEPAQIAA